MNNRDENENIDGIDTELAKSIEKLVEEETNVAKASFGNVDENSLKETHQIQEQAVNNIAEMKTQVMPSAEEVISQLQKKNVNAEEKLQHTTTINTQEVMQSQTKKAPNKKVLIGCIAGGAVLLLAVIIAVFVYQKQQSYDYNYSKGNSYIQNKEYNLAIKYLNKAYNTEKGKNNTDLMYTLAECYMQHNDKDNMKKMLEAIIAADKNNQKALSALGAFYVENNDSKSLNELLQTYKGTAGEQYLINYKPSAPKASEESGEFSEQKKIQLTADDGCKIYYTVDGTQPDKNSEEYKDELLIEKGTTKLKAIAVNLMGIESDTAEYTYKITYKQPNAPIITPAAGVYEAGEKVVIEAEEGMTIYYTTDNTTPTASSNVYTDPFDMPEGNSVVAAIAVSKQDLSSSVARKNYIVQAARSYTTEEALEILKTRMKALNIISAEGKDAVSGGKVLFTSQENIAIDETEYFVFRYEVVVNDSITSGMNFAVSAKNGQTYRLAGSMGSYEVSVF